MKTTKTIIALLGIALSVGFTSCKKNYSCNCKTTLSTSGYTSSSETKESYSLKLKEKQAKAACDNTASILEKQMKDQQTAQGTGLSTSVSCELK